MQNFKLSFLASASVSFIMQVNQKSNFSRTSFPLSLQPIYNALFQLALQYQKNQNFVHVYLHQ